MSETTIDTEITEVIFRRYQSGDILAVFPYIGFISPTTGRYEVQCYEHVGQHGSGLWHVIQSTTHPTTDKDQSAVNDLAQELTAIGYNLRIMRRISATKWEQVKQEAREAYDSARSA